MAKRVQQMEHICETAVVFLTIFLIINLLADEGLKKHADRWVCGFCMLRIIIAIAILLPEKEMQSGAAQSAQQNL